MCRKELGEVAGVYAKGQDSVGCLITYSELWEHPSPNVTGSSVPSIL